MNHRGIDRRSFVRAGISLGVLGLTTPRVLAAGPGASEAQGWQIGCYTRPWDQFEYRVALDGIAEAGYKYAGVMTAKGKSWVIITPQTTPDEASQIGEEIKKRGLKAISVYGDFPATEGVQKSVPQLRRLVENCVACGSPNLLLGGTSDPKAYDTYYHTIAECCDYALSQGVSLSVKPHGGLNATGPQCRKAIEQVNRRNFGLWYDPGNIFYYSNGDLDPVDDSSTVDGLVVGMSVKDFRRPKEVLLTPGTGLVKFGPVFDHLKRGGLTHGPLVVECLDPGDAAKITAQARKARQFLEELLGVS